jgi:hypothetical protein
VLRAPDGGGAGGEWAVAVTQRPGGTDAALGGLALRLFMHGWEAAAECMHTYQAFASRARAQLAAAGQQREGSAGGAAAASPAPAPAPAPAAGAVLVLVLPEGAPAAGASETVISVRLRGVCLEAVAASGRAAQAPDAGEPLPVPVARLLAHLSLTAHQGGSGGGSRLRVDLPAALLSLGSVPVGGLDDGMRLPLSDALLGVRGARLTVSATQAPADEAAGQPGHAQTAVDLQAAQVSLWACPRNVCVAAALAQHAAHMAAPLQGQGAPEAEPDKVREQRPALTLALPAAASLKAATRTQL